MISLMFLGSLWLPLVGLIMYYKWKNSVKFFVVEFDGSKCFLGNKFNPAWKKYDLVNIEFEKNLEQYSYFTKGVYLQWPLEEKDAHQWINRAYLKKREHMSVVTDEVRAASGPGKHFGKEFNFQWLFGDEGELIIVCYDNNEIKINLLENKEVTDFLKNYNVKLTKINPHQIEDWSVC